MKRTFQLIAGLLFLLCLSAPRAHAQCQSITPGQFSLNCSNDLQQLSTPSTNPPSGYLRMYAKTGSTICVLNNLGSETCFGSGGGGGSGFDTLTSGTNVNATMQIGTGAILNPTGTGTVYANKALLKSSVTGGAMFNFGAAGVAPTSPTEADVWWLAASHKPVWFDGTSATWPATFQANPTTGRLQIASGVNGLLADYLGATTCTNQFMRGLSATGASTCNSVANADLSNSSITLNGQAVSLGASGNVNNGAAAHSVSINQGAGSAITGVAIGTAGRLFIDQGSGADPAFVAASQDCTVSSAGAFTCTKTNNTSFSGLATLTETDGNIPFGSGGVWTKGTALPNGITATTQSLADNTTKVATTAFVIANSLTNPMTTLGDILYQGASSASRLAGPTSGNSPYTLTSTPSSSTSTAPTWGLAGIPVDTESGSSFTVQSDTQTTPDRAKLIVLTNNTTSTAVTLPQAGTSGFGSNFPFVICNQGSVIATITPTTSTINGNATLKLVGAASGNNPQCAFVWSDNSNYFAAEITPTNVNGQLQAAGMPALTGDVTNSAGQLATTVGKINGGSVPASAGVIGTNSSSQPVAATAAGVSSIYYVAGGGTAQAQTATLTPAVTSLVNGLVVNWLPLHANTTSGPTLAVNGLSAITVVKTGGSSLVANDLTTTAIASAIYDGTNFELQNPQTSGSSSGTVSNCSVQYSVGYFSSTGTTIACIGISDILQYNYVAGGGSAQAQSVTLAPALASYTAGVEFKWLPLAANSGADPTINANSLGTKTIKKCGQSALVANDLLTTAVAHVIYDGTYFQLQNPQQVPCGVAATSTALATARAINGQNFDGTAAINVNTGATAGTVAVNNGNGSALTAGVVNGDVLTYHTPATGIARTTSSSQAVASSELSGDATTSGSNAVTVVKINGGSVPASAAVLGSNSSSQPVAATAHQMTLPAACADSSGSGTAQSCNTSPSFTPASGDQIIYTTTTTNTADVTVNVNSLGAKHIRKWSASSVLASGDLVANVPVTLIYDGTYWEIPVIGNAPGGLSTTTFQSSAVQTNIGATTILTASSSRIYHVGGEIDITAAGVTCASATTIQGNLIVTNPNASGSVTVPISGGTVASPASWTLTSSATSYTGTAGLGYSFSVDVYVKTGTNLQFSTTNWSSGCSGTAVTYQITGWAF